MKILPNMPLDGRARYPWSEWFDGQVREATQGTDFTCTTRSFRQTVVIEARRRGFLCTTRVRGNVVVFQVTPKGNRKET